MKFRKKPVEVEAFKWCGNLPDLRMHLPMWLNDAMRNHHAWLMGDGSVNISTLEGVMRCNVGDWIIKGVKGELYPCKPDIFAATYESVEA